MKKLLLAVILISPGLYGAVKYKSGIPRTRGKGDIYSYRFHTLGGIWTVETNFGGYGDPNFGSTGNPSFDYPGGYGFAYLWEGRLWVGTDIDGNAYVSHAGYGEYEWEPDDGSWSIHTPGFSQKDIISRFHDWGAYNQGRAIGIHVIQRAYQWTIEEYGDFIAYEYEIIWDRSMSDIAQTRDEIKIYIGWCWDDDNCEADPVTPDRWLDDMVCFDGYTNGEWKNLVHKPSPTDKWTVLQDGTIEGSDGAFDQYQIYGDDGNEKLIASDTNIWIPRNMSYLYDEDDPNKHGDDMGENGKCPGFVFGRFIYGPQKADDFYFKDSDGNQARIPRVSSHQWWNWNNDPGTDEEKLDYMRAVHPMSMGYKFLPIPFDVGASVMDYRFLQTVGPYKMEPYDTLRIVYVSGIGYGLNGGVDEVYGTGKRLGARQVADYALDAYYMGCDSSDPMHPSSPVEDIHWQIPVPPETPELHYSSSRGKIKLIWSNIAERTPDPITGIVDFAGYRIYRSKWNPGNWKLIDSFTVHQGNLKREYTDLDVSPGIPYYYAVASFDSSGLESGKTNYLKDENGAEVPIYVNSPLGTDLDSVRAVPNPYYGSASWEAKYEDMIRFVNLPQNCRIKIYTLTGDLIKEIIHKGPGGDETWDIVSEANIKVSSGLYVYKIEQSDEDGKKVMDSKIGKLLIMR